MIEVSNLSKAFTLHDQGCAAFPALEVVMVTAPAPILASRLAARGRETAEDIAARLDRAALSAPEGARLVINDAGIDIGLTRLGAALNVQAAGA